MNNLAILWLILGVLDLALAIVKAIALDQDKFTLYLFGSIACFAMGRTYDREEE